MHIVDIIQARLQTHGHFRKSLETSLMHRRDPGARSGELSDDHRVAEVPHTETSVTASSEDNTAVVPLTNGQQSQSQVISYLIF